MRLLRKFIYRLACNANFYQLSTVATKEVSISLLNKGFDSVLEKSGPSIEPRRIYTPVVVF
tara:strand:- start:66 stop:248 length:183 start_codon:yes stop_codon:yes gene_type:complete